MLAAAAAMVITASAAVAAPREFELSSPDGKLDVLINVGQTVTYSLSHDDTLLLEPSQVSMELYDGTCYGIGSRFVGKKSRAVDQRIEAINYRRSEVLDRFNELTLRFKGFNLVFRAYDDGMAYRFVSLSQEPF